ncbi:hypothetical protein ATK17_1877 [Branchiibius hedensis]|uniref:Uncharacterized protein n=2 Tax=Branchiibius hedensis TaxID=672460 RepID=A0A2Y9C1L7_9MICO|nr:hypothetical protein ATK17_1877 [Branchiibius hedensis]SSA34553.1 hypothetical protein SAMN04489750_1877 [Branchiibius hedensis]
MTHLAGGTDTIGAMSSSLVSLAQAVPKLEENELPMPHWAYGVLGLLFFAALLGVLWFFRRTVGKGVPQDHSKQGH